ncbi:zinc-binding dehydrogenase [Candidatus Calescamantes bacterium]|nr:zinc-binding dehydrogenase [Candidatus Calescamantes bacterium]
MGKDKRYKSKVIVFSRPEKAEIRKGVPTVPVDENAVVIKTKYSGISRGTEMDLYHNQMHTVKGKTQWYPLIPSYEAVGEVIEVGKNVKHIRIGDRVIGPGPIDYGGDENICIAWGGQQEYQVATSKVIDRIRKIPENVSYQEAVFAAELGGVALHGIEKVGIKGNETVLVIGQGTVGNLAAQICKMKGCRVIVSDLYDYRLEISRKVGIEETINARREDQAEKVKELTGGEGPDVIIETTGEGKLLLLALDMVKINGRVHAQGMYLETIPLYIPDNMFIKNLTLSSSCGGGAEKNELMLKYISEGKIKVKPLISKIFSVNEAPLAYDYVDKHPEESVKVLLKWE